MAKQTIQLLLSDQVVSHSGQRASSPLEKNQNSQNIPLPRILLWSLTAIKLQRKAQPETLEGNITFETIVHHIL